jgi:hypothetical protein
MTNFLLSRLVGAALAICGFATSGCAHSPSPAEQGLAATSNAPPPIEDPSVEKAAPAPASPIVTDTGPAKRPEQRCESLVGEQSIKRSAVLQVVAAGLGSWLQGVQIDRVLDGRKFAGWKIGVLHLENPCYAAVDLRPGDIVVAINGQGPKNLERPESAQAVFDSLKKATAIEVAYLRDGKARQLRFEIVETPPQ